jgi:hypothetical protein
MPFYKTSFCVVVVMLLSICPADAQQSSRGQVAQSSVGQAGQRQARNQTTVTTEPLDRIDSRVRTRVESRIRTRIDRFYKPQGNAASSFELAVDQARIAQNPVKK